MLIKQQEAVAVESDDGLLVILGPNIYVGREGVRSGILIRLHECSFWVPFYQVIPIPTYVQQKIKEVL